MITQFIENWIALYLSPTDGPDVGTATCLSLQASGLTLYVANGKLEASDDDKGKLSEFSTIQKQFPLVNNLILPISSSVLTTRGRVLESSYCSTLAS